MLTARTILFPNLLQMSRQHPEEDKAYIQNDAHKSTEAVGRQWLIIGQNSKTSHTQTCPNDIYVKSASKMNMKVHSTLQIVSPMEKTH